MQDVAERLDSVVEIFVARKEGDCPREPPHRFPLCPGSFPLTLFPLLGRSPMPTALRHAGLSPMRAHLWRLIQAQSAN